MTASQSFSAMQNVSTEMMFWAAQTSFPGLDVNLASITAFGYGATEKRPTVPTFGECQIIFNCDAVGTQWQFFKNWLDFIANFDSAINGVSSTGSFNNPQQATYEISYKEDYMSTVIIQTYADNGQPNIALGLNETYPISLGNIQLDWGIQDQIAKFSVVFTFRDWYQVSSQAQVGALGTALIL